MPNDPIDKGLAEAFSPRDDETTIPASSVLRILQSRTQSQLGVHLDSPSVEDAPVKITDEVKQLRDPSGRYQVLGEIGRGGVGMVYKGRDHDLGRDVAMKVLKDEFATRPDVLARFVEEAQIGGQLQHPGIVPVYELGLQAGERPYFAMKLVKGETLAVHLARRDAVSEDRRRLLGVFEQVCQTMAYAHARRVVHRDLKPANIMIGAFGEVQVVDWGFAKVLPKGGVADEKESVQAATERSVIETVRSQEGSGSGSVAGSMLGTPAYMPPEQALGDIDRVDQRSDVFALGAILCEILTGEPPYRDADGDLVRQAANAQLDFAHERLANCGADAALIALCNECMSPARRARPESAQELAERVGDYLHSVEERARKAELHAAEVRFKHRVTIVAAAAALLLVALGAGSWIWLQNEEQKQRAADTQLVADAMSQTNRLLGNALAQSDRIDVTRWDAADQSAESLRSLLQSSDVESDVRGQADELVDQIERDSRDARATAAQQQRDDDMRERLENLRIPIDDNVEVPSWKPAEARRLDRGYSRAFAAYLGTSLFEPPVEATAENLRAGEIDLALATSLDHWGLVRDELSETDDPLDEGGTDRIRRLAAMLDPGDSWRSELRGLLPNAKGERDRLESLAQRADFAELSAAGCRVLSDALLAADAMDAAHDTLRRAREVHPTDFDLCFRLAVFLEFVDEPQLEGTYQFCRVAHALRPDRVEVLHRQGMALDRLGRHKDAERVFRKLDARSPDDPHWLWHLADAVVRQGHGEAGIDLYDRSLMLLKVEQGENIGLRRAIALNKKGQALEGLDRPDDAFACYLEAVASNPKNADAQSNLGNLYRQRDKLNKALDHHRLALDINAKDPRYLNNYGVTLTALGKPDEAVDCYLKALAADPGHHHALDNLRFLRKQQGRIEDMLPYIERALAQRRQTSELQDVIGGLYFDLGRLDDAIAVYRRAIALDKKNARAHNNLGHILLQIGKEDEAVQHFRAATEADPKDAVAWFNLGVGLQRQGKLADAADAYEHSIKWDPTRDDPYVNLCVVLTKTDRIDDAITWGETTIKRFPDMAFAHVNLGNALNAAGRRDEAVTCYRKAIELDDDLVQAHGSLCDVLTQLGQFEAAIEHGRKAVTHGRNYLPAHLNLGHAYRGAGRLDEAIRCFERAIALAPRNPNVLASLGSALARSGRFEDALTLFREAVQRNPSLEPRFGSAIRTMERDLAERPELLEIVAGERQAKDAGQWSRAAGLAYDQGRYADAVALTERTLRDAPQLVQSEHWGLYGPACSATLLTADPDSNLAARERSRIRALAHAWVEGEILGNPAKERLEWALKDPDFASVRGEALQALPEAERKAWEELWNRIEEAAKENDR